MKLILRLKQYLVDAFNKKKKKKTLETLEETLLDVSMFQCFKHHSQEWELVSFKVVKRADVWIN